MKYFLLYTLLLCVFTSFSQTVIWQDDFENMANWSLNLTSGANGPDANLWVLSDDEGGVAAGGCGTALNGNKTLHVSCQGQWCIGTGATYNAGDGGLGFMDATTHKQALGITNISTLNTQNLSLEMDYIGVGQPNIDFGTILYSINGGSSWNTLQTINSAGTCANSQGLWTHLNIPLPATCVNISNLRIGFEWVNDNDGAGTDPSLAINNLKITSPVQPSVTASYTPSSVAPCLGDCISITNTSTGANTFSWNFGNGETSTLQNPSPTCYYFPGTYNVELIACDGNTCDTSVMTISVQPLLTGTMNVTSQGPYTWPLNGMVYSTSGTYVDTAANVNACDSLVTLNLIINTGSLDDLNINPSHLIKITDITGREIKQANAQVVILYFEDGTTRKVYICE